MADDSSVALCTIEDVETYLMVKLPSGKIEYANRKINATSDVLRRLCRNEGWDLDKKIKEDPLTARQAKDTVAAATAISLKKTLAATNDDGQDLSAFSSFTQSAAGYSFTGSWNGNPEDVFFTQNQLTNMGIGLQAIRRELI